MIWLTRQIKWVFFWIYLWQLKEYHVGRFLDHFTTYKGKKLIFNLSLAAKIILVFIFLLKGRLFPYSLYVLLMLYFAEFIFLTILKLKKSIIRCNILLRNLKSFSLKNLFLKNLFVMFSKYRLRH